VERSSAAQDESSTPVRGYANEPAYTSRTSVLKRVHNLRQIPP
jgi:hypothetical protein